jgi:hypothetical protein
MVAVPTPSRSLAPLTLPTSTRTPVVVDALRLDVVCRAVGPLSLGAVARIGRQIAEQLLELHEGLGAVHGALSPARIVVKSTGDVELVDFGRARPDDPRFLSPERQASDGVPTASDDLWALGVLLADCALGAAFDVEKPIPALIGQLPERFTDALAVLVAPANARLTRAAAAVRIFSELEKRFLATRSDDGQAALRAAVETALAARRELPDTIPDVAAVVVEPKTVELGRDGVLPLGELRRIAAVAQEMELRRRDMVPVANTARIREEQVAAPGRGDATLDDEERAAVRSFPWSAVLVGGAMLALVVLAALLR